MQMVQIHACPHDLEKIRKRVAPLSEGSCQARCRKQVVNPVIREILCDIRLDWLRTVDERPAQNAVEF